MSPTITLSSERLGSRLKLASVAILLSAAPSFAFAQVAPGVHGHNSAFPLSLGEVFTFLFLTLGPFNVLTRFLIVAQRRDVGFRRRLAFGSVSIAAIALFLAAAQGAYILEIWGVSVGALLLTAGVVLFLVALQPLLAQYQPREGAQSFIDANVPPRPIAELAFSLTFPAIVTPYGIAVLILMLTLRPIGTLSILALAAFVLAVDLVAMLASGLILKVPFITPALGIVAAVMGVLQVALGIQAMAAGLRLLGIVGNRGG